MSKTMEKGLRLLDLFTEEKSSWGLDEISTVRKIPRPTCHRLLQSLVNVGFLQRLPYERNGQLVEGDDYILGLKLLQLGERVASNLEIKEIAFPYMKQLQSEIHEAVQLVTRDHDTGIYIEKVESTRPVRLYTRVGRHAPLYAGACTRTLLAFLPDEEIKGILGQPMQQFASQTPQTAEEVWALIRQTRTKGFAYSDSELAEGTVSIAVPIFNHRKEVQYSLSVAGFAVSLPIEEVHQVLEPLWQVAAILSKQIGFTEPYPYGK